MKASDSGAAESLKTSETSQHAYANAAEEAQSATNQTARADKRTSPHIMPSQYSKPRVKPFVPEEVREPRGGGDAKLEASIHGMEKCN